MAESLPPLEGGDDLPPLEGPGDMPLEADHALGLPNSSKRSVASYMGIPGSEIDTSPPMTLYGEEQEAPDAVTEAIRLARTNATSSSAEEARKALIFSRDLGLGSNLISGRVKDFEKAQQQEEVNRKMAQLPSYKIQWWMSQSPAHAAALQKELDSWGWLDWMFGKYTARDDASEHVAEIIRQGGPDVDKKLAALHRPVGDDLGTYERPVWYQAYGRTMYSMTTSIQSHFMAKYGATKDTGKALDEIKKQRDFASFPLPGEDVYVRDGEGGAKRAGGEPKPAMRAANSLVGMVPIIAAAHINPALAAGLIYAETSGRTYEDLRLQGWEHEHAAGISEIVGFISGGIAAATGGMFKFSFLPKPVIGSMMGLSNGVTASIGKNPNFWRGAWGLGKNFLANTAMNMMMAGSEVSIREAFDSTKQNRPYNYSKVTSATADAAHAWAEMLALSVLPAYKEHLANKVAYRANVELTQDQADRARFVEAVYNNYEERGQDLRSMHEASRIVSAAESIKDSEFMRDNPEDARNLVQMLVAPRGSQTVYLRPEAVAKLPPSALEALGVHDISLGANDAKVPVNLVDLLMHPDGEALAKQAAGEPDLKAASELGSVDFAKPSEDVGPVTDENLDAYLAEERERRKDRTTSRLPTPDEIHSAVQGALEQDTLAPRSKEGALPPTDYETGGRRRPSPDLGPRERKAAPSTIPAPMNEAGLRRWAQDAVKRLPTGALSEMASSHERAAEAATREALDARKRTADGKFPSAEAQAKGDEAERRAQVSGALHKALRDGVDEVRSHVDYFSKQASDEPLPKGGKAPRDAAWSAGQEYGAAHDAIMQSLGLGQGRTSAAPDLSDIYDKLARRNHLPEDGFEGWDLRQSNQLLKQQAKMPERSLEDLRLFKSVLEQLGRSADAENSSRALGIRIAKAMMRDEIAEHLKNLPDLPPGQRALGDNPKALDVGEGAEKGLAEIKAELNKPSTLMLKLGKVGERLYFEHFVPGVARENSMWGDVAPVIRQIDRDMPREIGKMGRDKIIFPNGPKDATPNGEVHLRSDVWDLVLKVGVHGADVKIAEGMGFKDFDEGTGRDARTITATQQLWDWIHANIADTPQNAHIVMEKLITPHWKLFENYLWPQIEKMFKEQGLAPPEKLRARTMTIHGKDFEGGYGGRLKWLEVNNKPVIHAGSFESLLGSDVSGPYTDQRHLAMRDPEFSGKPVFSWDGLVSDIRKEIHDVAMRPFLEDAHKIFSDPEIRTLLANKMGKQALSQIYNPNGTTDWLHTVARGSVGDVQSAKAWTRALFKFQGLAAYSAFSLNTRVMLGQLSHIPAAMAGLGLNPAHTGEAFAAAFSPERRGWAHAASEVLRLRYANYEERAVELTRQLTGLEPGRDVIRRTTDHVNFMAWREMDAFLSHAIWEAAYSKAIGRWQVGGEPLGHEAAVRQADIAVTRMMPAQDIYDQSAFVRDRSVLGFSYMVRNFPNTLANVAALNHWNARLQGPGTKWQGAAARIKSTAQYVGMVMAAEMGKGIIMQGGPRDRDDPEHWYASRLFGAMVYPYMISELATGGYEALSGNRHAARQEIDRMLPASIGVIGQGIDDIGRFFQNGDEEAAYRAAAHLAGLMAKTPLTSLLYNLSNAARNSEDPLDAGMKAMGYRR